MGFLMIKDVAIAATPGTHIKAICMNTVLLGLVNIQTYTPAVSTTVTSMNVDTSLTINLLLLFMVLRIINILSPNRDAAGSNVPLSGLSIYT